MSILEKKNGMGSPEGNPETRRMVSEIRKLFDGIQKEKSREKGLEIDEKQFILLLGGISACRKIPGILGHMGYESLYVCERQEDAAAVADHLDRMYGIRDKEGILHTCRRLFSSDEDYVQFESFWKGKPVFDIKRLNPQGRETFETCRDYAKLFEPLVKEGGFFAWDCNERIGLCRAAYACGMLEEDEFWQLTVPLAREAECRYDSWAEYAMSCLCGAIYFMFCQSAMKEEACRSFYEINRNLVSHLLREQGAWERNEWFHYPKKKFAKNMEEIKNILRNWEGPEGCIATDRIVVDGCKVGYMYREEPEAENSWDSGWRFMAGDESDEYMNNPENSGIYALNTICNYDEDIMGFLHSPYKNAYFRDKDGIFKWEELREQE
ncbi:MAG: DUF2185 domain-containing protein [Roseburia sp.]|nr:DUF2185 domain-containing protein [Roseburia sp.]MCM1277807.1 DUF2185 domain-containing protein [Robinsoniella sp.]